MCSCSCGFGQTAHCESFVLQLDVSWVGLRHLCAPCHAAAEQENRGEGIAEHEGKAHRRGNGLQVSPSEDRADHQLEDLADGTARSSAKWPRAPVASIRPAASRHADRDGDGGSAPRGARHGRRISWRGLHIDCGWADVPTVTPIFPKRGGP